MFGQPSAAAAVGESAARALSGVDSPYLTSVGPGYIVRKSGEFTRVDLTDPGKTADRALHLWGTAGSTSASVVNSTPGKAGKTLPQSVISHPDGAVLALDTGQWVGDRRIVTLRETRPVVLSSTVVWPVLELASSAAEVEPASALAARRSVSYVNAAPAAYALRALFATGWGDTDTRYRWGYARMGAGSSNPSAADANVPQVVLGNTALAAPVTVTLPHEAGRCHFSGSVFCTGPGRLVALFLVAEQFTAGVGFLPKIDPFFCASDDHGQTWSRHSAGFLIPFLRSTTTYITGGSMGRAGYDNAQLEAIGVGTISFSYVGNGKSIGSVSWLVDTPSSTDFAEKVYTFIYDSTAKTFTRITAPTDSASSYDIATFGAASNNISRCFGPGCYAVEEFNGAHAKIHSTRDYGATWTTSTSPSARVGGLTALAPYESPDKPGALLLVRRAPGGAAGSDVYQTDGTFSSFTHKGRIYANQVISGGGEHVVLLARRSPRSLFRVELPDEFNQPR